ncbi:4a-hydroxytetrahydrobiopterin dehydratase [Inhella gelatinilytica]|uniref:4a-hydroxytetrahydrobiopterin dehydratase n=1 Tax=Inhella gelatinilytica TaxID=2795030 RepID=A0A931IZ92_9BURK|nr:4a-hydroxytetrahydrobiopterin dehydratase [Inhella gelatinilytica]MBH9554336.1 4a-hydroxytetrahydrobiopterin dehydratase [Inhella gelatinilytica]
MTQTLNLLTARCTAHAPALSAQDQAFYLAQLPGWAVEGNALVGRFGFDNFREVMDFANAVAEVAETHDHHPELSLRYRQAVVRFSTHSAGDQVTLNDVICAVQVSHLPEAAGQRG